jgi:hypothetical protein
MILKPEPRYVFDTNVLISAFLFPTSTPRRAFDFTLDHGKLLISLPLLRELYGVLHYPKFDQYASPAQRTQFVDLLTIVGTLTTITVQLNVVRDPKDNFVLELAVSGRANAIISGDTDLLTLGVYDSIPIRTPAQFLQDNSQPYPLAMKDGRIDDDMDQLDATSSARPRVSAGRRALFFFIGICLIGCLIAAILIGIQALTGNARGIFLSVIALSAAILYVLIVVAAFTALIAAIVGIVLRLTMKS